MNRRTPLVTLAVLAPLLLSGCAGAAAQDLGAPTPSHAMPDGSVMSGSEHAAHSSTGDEKVSGPSEAALMICEGQVPDAVGDILGLDEQPKPDWSWEDPSFRCTYSLDGAPLILSVHDVSDAAEGEAHFADLQAGLPGAVEIEGMAGLGMPSFSTPDGVAAFLRDGKTLLVDATALPGGLGPDGNRTQQQIAYTIASAVLACWVEHD